MTKEMDEDALKSLKVNKERLMEDLHHTCQWGTGKRWGEYAASLPSTTYNGLRNSEQKQKQGWPVLRFLTQIRAYEIGL